MANCVVFCSDWKDGPQLSSPTKSWPTSHPEYPGISPPFFSPPPHICLSLQKKVLFPCPLPLFAPYPLLLPPSDSFPRPLSTSRPRQESFPPYKRAELVRRSRENQIGKKAWKPRQSWMNKGNKICLMCCTHI